ncbi:hypothetical protein CC53_gp153 [Rhizobium phage vB_RleS_L338C]|uniref:hypothetical protein n=1 Tax=Rhizobium phage vB_RleS_L338C TaxID=1414737 RepID=UPI0003D88B2A|nr:hypothetical protein CC53_gp153 [Rhizobium phage vB_RleS_L338C]AHC30570.1 hypothetical protein L338C_153 [Rhizobium phage vB_RleS_L338C]QNH72091.1 hypothetical protein P11VFA_167 [Rhizobium phage P11VFA]
MSDALVSKWWMARSLSTAERATLTPEQKAERRAQAVHWRLEDAEKKLTVSRRKRMTRWLNQWFRGEVMRELLYNEETGGFYSLKAFIRSEFIDAVRVALRGTDQASMLERIIRGEVGKVLRGNAYGTDADGQAKMEEYIQKLVKEEVKKQVMSSLSIDIAVTGRVFSPPAGQRRVDLGAPE